MVPKSLFDSLVLAGFDKATDACVLNLHRLGWTPDEIRDAAEPLSDRLKAACKVASREGLSEFLKAVAAGVSAESALAVFCIPLIAAGVRVGSDHNAARREAERLADEAVDRVMAGATRDVCRNTLGG